MNDKNSEIVIRKARREDMVAVTELAEELINYLAKDLERDAFDIRPPRFHCLLAEFRTSTKTKIIGCATYIMTYCPGEGCCGRLQILFVSADYRRQGIGRKLFSGVAKEALLSGCERLLFRVTYWNEGARLFYEQMGAVNVDHCDLYELSGEALRNTALEST